jgi:hypothetical protein
MNLKFGSIDWTFICSAEWKIELNIDLLIDYLDIRIIDWFIDWLFCIGDVVHSCLPRAQFAQVEASYLIDCCGGRPEVSPQP